MLDIALIAGSGRKDSQSGKVTRYLQQRLNELGLCTLAHSSLFDLGQTPLPLWPADDSGLWSICQAQLSKADALILVVPEWHGMACPAVKNFFLYASKVELAHKPALLVGVSAGVGGAYPISELRASSYKNCRLCYLPEHLIVRQVGQVLNDPAPASQDDQRIRLRIDYALRVLGHYAQALRPVRVAIDFSNPAFANGM